MARRLAWLMMVLALSGCQNGQVPLPTAAVARPTRVPAPVPSEGQRPTSTAQSLSGATAVSGPTVTPQSLGAAPTVLPPPTAAATALPSGSAVAVQPPLRPERCAIAPAVRRLPGLRLGAALDAAPDLLAQIERAQEIKASWISLPVSWAAIEPQPRGLSWGELDSAVDAANAAGLAVLLLVRDTPRWAAGPDVLPAKPDDLGTFLTALAGRYTGKARAYQVWELPNVASGGKPAAPPERYAEALLLGSRALRATDPCALVLAGGLLPNRGTDPAVALDDLVYYQKLLRYDPQAIDAAYDGLAVPLRTGDAAPGAHTKQQNERYQRFTYLERLRNELVAQGQGDKQLWVTFGWSTRTGGVENEAVDAGEQAEYTLKAIERTSSQHPWVATLLLRGLSAQPPAADSPDYRIVRDDGNPLETFRDLAKRKLPGRPDPRRGLEGVESIGVLWKTKGVGEAAPGVSLGLDDTLRLASDGQWTYALDSNGAFQWSYRLANQQQVTGIATGPDGVAYLGSDERLLASVSAAGAPGWEVLLPEPLVAAPAVRGDAVYLPLKKSLAAVSTADGSLRWQLPLGSIPGAVAVAADGTVYVGSDDGKLHAVGSDGQPRWVFDTGRWARGAPLLLADGSLVVGSDGGTLWRLGPDGQPRWRLDLAGSLVATPAVGPDGTLYVPSTEGVLVAVSPDGVVRWQQQLGGTAVFSPAVNNNGTILAAGGPVLTALDNAGNTRWRFTAPEPLIIGPQASPSGLVVIGDASGALYGLGPLVLRDRLGWNE